MANLAGGGVIMGQHSSATRAGERPGRVANNILIPPPPPVTPPVISGYVPAAGSSIEKNTAIQFDVTDDSGQFSLILLAVTLNGIMEVVHDGSAFKGLYAGASVRSIIANGFRFTVVRQGGWTGSPTFETFAIDAEGNRAP